MQGVSRFHETRYLFWSESAKVSIEYRYNDLFTHKSRTGPPLRYVPVFKEQRYKLFLIPPSVLHIFIIWRRHNSAKSLEIVSKWRYFYIITWKFLWNFFVIFRILIIFAPKFICILFSVKHLYIISCSTCWFSFLKDGALRENSPNISGLLYMV